MPSLKTCVLAGGLLAVPGAGALAVPAPELINVHSYKDAASLREAIEIATARLHYHLPPLHETDGASRRGQPSIISGKILTDRIQIAKPPGVPRVRVSFDAPNRLNYIELDFVYPTAQLEASVYAASPPGETSGTRLIETAFSPWGNYAASGDWKLKYAVITDELGGYVMYSGKKLAALFPSLDLNVQNAIAPDNTRPAVTAGEILTPVVHANRLYPAFKAKLSVLDNLSGVQTIFLFLKDPSGNIVIDFPTTPPSPVKEGTVLVKDGFFGAPSLGTWTIYGYQVCDVPYNCALDDNATDIQKLFGTNTFVVVK